MIRRESIHDRTAAPAARALFARKGEAVPVGGRTAPRRVITMRPLSRERHKPIALPRPANTSTPVPAEPRNAAWPDNVAPLAPTVGPVAGPAAILAASTAEAKAAPAPRIRMPIRTPVRAVPVRDRVASNLTDSTRTTFRLNDAMRVRLERFAGSETLSAQALLARALERFLPAISVERPGAASLPLATTAHPGNSATGSRRSVRFDRHLYWRLKTAAAKRGRSMQAIMVAALDAYLDGLERGVRTAPRDGAESGPAVAQVVRPLLVVA